MAGIFATQLEPFEENQSPSPTREDKTNPYELSLQRSISPSRRSPSSPTQSNSLHRQLSLSGAGAGAGAEPPSPSPPWQPRRLSSSSRSPPPASQPAPAPAPQTSAAPHSRRHPSLTMTPSGLALPADSAVIDDAGLGLPKRPFAPSGRSSNRSSTYSYNQDLSSLTSEELWSLESNIRPLDHARRHSRIESRPVYAPLPPELIWPDAMNPEELYQPPQRTQSVMSISSLAKKKTARRKGGRTSSTGPESRPPVSIQTSQVINAAKAYSTPASPVYGKPTDGFGSSRNSSSTSIASNLAPGSKSYTGLPRPPSAYYSRDFLSGLAARDGGYAIAREIGGLAPGSGANSPAADERRRSGFFQDGQDRPRPERRAPPSRSSGMGRWSLDGGEHYGKPYATPSASTTQSNLYPSPDPSPPADELVSEPQLPEGASLPAQTDARALEKLQTTNLPGANTSPNTLPSTTPVVSSPLAQAAVTTARQQVLLDSAAPTPVPSPKKSKKEMAAELKAAKEREKAEGLQLNKARAQAARDAALAKEKEKEAAKRQAKLDKQRAKDEEKRKKLEAKKNKLRSTSATALSIFSSRKAPASSNVPPVPVRPAGATTSIPRNVSSVAAPSPVAPTPVSSMSSAPQSADQTPTASSPAPSPAQSATSMPSVTVPLPSAEASAPLPAPSPAVVRQPQASMPPQNTASNARPGPAKRNNSIGVFGTIRKRFSVFGLDKEGAPVSGAALAQPRSPPSLAAIGAAVHITSPAHLRQPSATVPITEGVRSASDLPPRASSRGASPVPASPSELGSPPPVDFATAPSSPTPEIALVRQSSAQSGVSRVASSNTHERPERPVSGVSLGRASSAGPRGPRAMPSSPPLTRSRTASTASPSAAHSHTVPHSSQSTFASYDAHAPQIPPGAAPPALRPGLAPALSGMSDWASGTASAPSSHSTGTEDRQLSSDLASPWSSGSRKSSMTSAESRPLFPGVGGAGEDKREHDGSKSSNETVQAEVGTAPAAPMVPAH